MKEETFDFSIADSQSTDVEPVSPELFDIDAYCEYEASLLEKNKKFWNSKDQGVMVYRRFRTREQFTWGCRDMDLSLRLQLGGLKESMKYKADLPNFLEPWYGIGTVASSFGMDYVWPENQAPALMPKFKTIAEALEYPYVPVEKTEIGRHTLEMIEYFLDKTKGKIPLSMCDIQSPLNIASNLMQISDLFLEMYDYPEEYEKLVSIITDLLIDFSKRQEALIGNALVKPGHGFGSSRVFSGLGLSDDNVCMISDSIFNNFEVPQRERIGSQFGGVAFHSCGNWSKRVNLIKQISNLVMVDGAFTVYTDPDPNNSEPFAEAFANSGIVVNARMVGDVNTIKECVKKIWKQGMKLVVVTHCKTPEEQEEAYNAIHEICGC